MAERPETEIVTLHRWLDHAMKNRLMGGYPLGQAYLDERRDNTKYYDGDRDYVMEDRRAARRLPRMIGKRRYEVRERIEKLIRGES